MRTNQERMEVGAMTPRCIDMELDGVISLEKGHVKLEAKRCKVVTTKGTKAYFCHGITRK